MSNTVEYDGLIGTVNTVYMLADNTHVVLEGADENGFEVSKIDGNGVAWYERTIYPSQLVAGTITKAPVKLEDGFIYTFCMSGGSEWVGYYSQDRKSFFCNGNKVCGENEAANIVKLVPEVK